jgi:hypothetical protein
LLPQAVMARWGAVKGLEAPRVEEVAAVHTAVLACLAEALNTSSGPNAGLHLYLHGCLQALASNEVGTCSPAWLLRLADALRNTTHQAVVTKH